VAYNAIENYWYIEKFTQSSTSSGMRLYSQRRVFMVIRNPRNFIVYNLNVLDTTSF
jgi:hypothetical protein